MTFSILRKTYETTINNAKIYETSSHLFIYSLFHWSIGILSGKSNDCIGAG